ncbi:hypothetical protein [Xenorhabdus indica]|nr:hypothetical protein [Xenorhabdus indica]MBC8945366.1 hypothetical protein [Xenorhabdus indica]
MENNGSVLFTILLIVGVWLIMFIPMYRIAKKAGYGLGLAICLSLPFPLVPLIALWFFAFTTWPIERYIPKIPKSN